MQNGAQLITQLIQAELKDFFTDQQVLQTAHLVLIHDEVENLKTEEELLLMEADTLGMIDTSRVKPTFSLQDNKIFMEKEIYNRRLLHFIHPFAIEKCEYLAKQRQHFYN